MRLASSHNVSQCGKRWLFHSALRKLLHTAQGWANTVSKNQSQDPDCGIRASDPLVMGEGLTSLARLMSLWRKIVDNHTEGAG